MEITCDMADCSGRWGGAAGESITVSGRTKRECLDDAKKRGWKIGLVDTDGKTYDECTLCPM